jgi:hypothetical protein
MNRICFNCALSSRMNDKNRILSSIFLFLLDKTSVMLDKFKQIH